MDDVAEAHPGMLGWKIFRRPPRYVFHLALVPAACLVLLSASVPGFSYGHFAVGGALAVLGAAAWATRLGLSRVVAKRAGQLKARPFEGWYLVAPVAGLLVLALTFTDVPLRIRWAVAESAFEDVVAIAPPPTASTEWTFFEAPSRLGTYSISQVARVRDGIVFFEATGSFLNDAGFAYLPTGPFPELENGSFERPDFRPLGGGWYAWTASW